jgi:hypothetical protein
MITRALLTEENLASLSLPIFNIAVMFALLKPSVPLALT